jgi:hypothetical protein
LRCVKRMHVDGIEPLYSNCRRDIPTNSWHFILLQGLYSWTRDVWGSLQQVLFKLLGLLLLQQCWWTLQSSGYDAVYFRRLVYRYESTERACSLRVWRHSRRRTALKIEAANPPKRWRPYTCLNGVKLE